MRKCYSILLAIVGVVAALGAAEFQKRKPAQEWTREETLEFFRSSPWVRRALVKSGMPRSDSLPFSGSVFEGQTLSGGACLSCARIEPQRERPSGAGSGSESGVGIPGRVGGVYFVQWTSAKIVRQGHAHLRALERRGTEEAVPLVPDVYVLTVGGPDLQVFEGVEESQLQAGAYLRPKKSKAKVAATRVSVLRGADHRISVVHFGFPRELDGQPIIDEKERSVEFLCLARDVTLRANFDLTKMVVQQSRDL